VKKRRVLISISAVAIAAIIVVIVLIARERQRRHRVFRREAAAPIKVAKGIPPVEQWTEVFSRLPPSDLVDLLDEIETKHPDLYSKWSLAYLHARAMLEKNDTSEAAKKLAPFLAAGHPLRDLALYHQSEIDDGEAASRSRQALIFGYPKSLYRDQAIDEETEYLKDPKRLTEFAAKLFPSADTARRRDLDAHIAEALFAAGDANGALAKSLAILRGGTTDDASERVARALDKPELIKRLNAQQIETLGETMQNHRHFDRAVALLSSLPAKSADNIFSIGRSYFGDEKYVEAQQTYMRGANSVALPAQKAMFLWHAARAAQLHGDDAGAERLMTASIAIPGRSPSQIAALTQRVRVRLKQKRIADANADINLLKKLAPGSGDIAAVFLAEATAMIAMNNGAAAVVALNSIPPKFLGKYERGEVAYWRGRALESRDPHAAFAAYVDAARSDTPFAKFARERIAKSPVRAQELAARDAKIAPLLAAKNYIAAKPIATERFIIQPSDQLVQIYRQLPAYRAVLEMRSAAFPQFPLTETSRANLLMAMGLFDEASEDIPGNWSRLTQSLALNRGGASRQSIYQIEVLMKSVPADFADELLPTTIRQLLYPRYFAGAVEADSKKFNADPTLVLAIMREESRFNPRAKSEAAARGLLQFIITTAREIGREAGLVDVTAEDLYDPRVIIQLGAKYIGTLLAQFGNDHYATAAAYNAGPKQVALWQRLAPAAGDGAFISAINFDETKGYVRKVMTSYAQYAEIYTPTDSPAITRSYTSR
jgi:soluble lytic murein transglycosylase-like protein